MNAKGKHVVCLLPEKTLFGRVTSQLIADIGEHCRELGFSVKYSRSLASSVIQLILSEHKLWIILYPGLFNPIVRSLARFIAKLLIGFNLLFLRFLGKKIILYVYDLPIEQNIFAWNFAPYEKLSRIIEALYLRVASLLLVFNELTSRHLVYQYELPKHSFEYFEILDYGFDIPSLEKKTHGFWELQNSLLSGIQQPEGSPKKKSWSFLSNCDETSKNRISPGWTRVPPCGAC
jgi:hypothetical protein